MQQELQPPAAASARGHPRAGLYVPQAAAGVRLPGQRLLGTRLRCVNPGTHLVASTRNYSAPAPGSVCEQSSPRERGGERGADGGAVWGALRTPLVPSTPSFREPSVPVQRQRQTNAESSIHFVQARQGGMGGSHPCTEQAQPCLASEISPKHSQEGWGAQAESGSGEILLADPTLAGPMGMGWGGLARNDIMHQGLGGSLLVCVFFRVTGVGGSQKLPARSPWGL